jgi:sodium pump decarboxylase gamma subunit
MISESLFITCVGMGGVFLFLSLMIFVMESMRILIARTEKKKVSDKIAAVIAIVQSQES